MKKWQIRRKIISVNSYLQKRISDAYEMKNETMFDWYSEGQQVFFQVVQGKPIQVTKRVKPLCMN